MTPDLFGMRLIPKFNVRTMYFVLTSFTPLNRNQGASAIVEHNVKTASGGGGDDSKGDDFGIQLIFQFRANIYRINETLGNS